MAFVGVDLHSNSFTICRLGADGGEDFETYNLSEVDLKRFCARLEAGDELAVEATGNSAWFCEEVRPHASRIVVVNPRRFQVIRKSVSKTDRNDARALAFFLSKDMLPETRLKSVAESELTSLAHTRDVLVKQRTMLLNKVHALFSRYGMKLKKEGLASRKRLTDLDVSRFTPLEQAELEALRVQALSLSDGIARLDKTMEAAASKLDGFEGVSSIKGVGTRSAAILLAGIGDIEDFESADKLAAYIGIVPRVSQSNETDKRGRITKRGDKLIRTTLVQCTLIAKRYSSYLNTFYQRIKHRRGAGKAIIATARKLLAIIYDTLKNGWVFEDFTQFKIKENQHHTGQPS
ncbi:MAG: IS110 family transposase [Pseudomonadota bacterium]